MALATQCPHCHTTFRVAQDQLKLRAGLVRCGSCKEIFNGLEHLVPLDAVAQEPAPSSTNTDSDAALVSPSTDIASESVADAIATDGTAEAEGAQTPVSDDTYGAAPFEDAKVASDNGDGSPAEERDGAGDGTLEHTTPMATAEETPALDQPAPSVAEFVESTDGIAGQSAIASPSANADADTHEMEEPGFVKRGRRKQQVGRTLRVLMGAGSALLLAGLFAQAVYSFRVQISASFPQTKPTLVKACTLLRCDVGLPAQIEAISIESSDWQPLPANKQTFALSMLLRNHSATVQAWPHVELTLNDTNDKAVARRVLTPRDYLSTAQDLPKGLAATSEQPVKLFFDLSQLKAAGYRVYLFYP